ncbi:MAG: hypothetical protein KAH22_11890 [Thiotrichaceae bacterium]|nr:hypothetical protein [Thiotrichaceae bacterium]
MKFKFALIPTLIPMLVLPVTASAIDYTCYRQAKPTQTVKQRKPKGNWGPQHKVSNWRYDAIKGPDIYRHKRGKRVVGTRCKGIGYNYGQLRIDFVGKQDWCVKTVSGQGATHATPSCPSGYTISPNKQSCQRPAVSGQWKKKRKPKGNWGPQHKVSNWSYQAAKGKDIYRHKRGKRVVGTRCKGIGYNYGQHKVDLVGNQDWCASWQGGQSAHRKPASCPSNYRLIPKKKGIRPPHSGTGKVQRVERGRPIRIERTQKVERGRPISIER